MPDELRPATQTPPDPAAPTPAPALAPQPPRRAARWRRLCVKAAFALAALLTVLLALGYHYTRPKQLTPLVAGLIGQAVGGVAQLDRAEFSFDGSVTLEGMTLSLPKPHTYAPGYAQLWDCQRIAVRLDFRRVLSGVVDVSEIEIRRPRIHLVENPATGRLNIEDLPLPRRDDRSSGVELRLPPSISLVDAQARFATLDSAGVDHTDAVLQIAGELREQADHPRRYDLALQTYGSDAVADTQLKGWVDTRNPGMNLDLAGLAFNASYRPFVPPAFRALWDRLEPVGQVPTAAVNLETDSAGRVRLNRAVLELANVNLTPPYAELALFDQEVAPNAAGPRYAPRMTGVNGRLIADHNSVRIENLTGTIEGVHYHLNGTWGIDAATPGALTLQTDPFTIDRNPLFVSGLPTAAARLFAHMNPSGRFQATTQIRRATPGGEVAVSGRVKIIDARATYAKFPFPVENIRGAVSFDPDAVRLEGLTGRGPAGGVITLNGEIAPPRRDAGVRLLVTARDVPYDADVRTALGKNAQAADLFFDQAPLDALHLQAGVSDALNRPTPDTPNDTTRDASHTASQDVAQDTANTTADTASTPAPFALGGNVKVDVLIDRPPGPDRTFSVRTTLHPAGMGMVFGQFPYPMTATGGQVVITPGNTEVKNLTLVGPTGASATVSGHIGQPHKGGPPYPNLEITDVRAPADALLMAALPASAQQHLRPLRLTGEARGEVSVLRPPNASRARFVVRGGFTGAQARPSSGTLGIHDLDAGFEVTQDHAEITALHGTLSTGGTLDLNARFDWAPGQRGFTVQGGTRDTTFGPALADLIPDETDAKGLVLDLMESWKFDGVGDLRLQLQQTNASPDHREGSTAPHTDYTLEVEPRTLSLVYNDTPLAFEAITGRATVRPGHLELDGITGTFPTGQATVNGDVGLIPGTHSVLEISGQTALPSTTAGAVLPTAVFDALVAVSINGQVTLNDARLLLRPDASDHEDHTEFDARLGLTDARINLGVPVTDINGEMLVKVRTGADRVHPAINLGLNLQTARVSDRLISPLTVDLDNERWADTLTFGPLLGSVYGGVLVGEGCIPLTDQHPCRVRLNLIDVATSPFIAAGTPAAAQATGPNTLAFANAARAPAGDLLSAGITLEIPIDRPEDIRGRGTLEVRDPKLFNRPLSNAILRATNFSLPSGSPLDRASAHFLINGDTLRFDDLSISGDGLSITGAGTMTLSDQRLRLLMASRNTDGPNVGPFSDLVEIFRDELIAIKVRGTLSDPTTEVTALNGIRKSLRTLFGDD